MGAFFSAGGFSIKQYQKQLSIARNRISDKQYDLDRINLPTLILHSLDDGLVDYDFAKYAHAKIPDSKLITFSSGGHVLLGHREQYREVVAGFLKKHL